MREKGTRLAGAAVWAAVGEVRMGRRRPGGWGGEMGGAEARAREEEAHRGFCRAGVAPRRVGIGSLRRRGVGHRRRRVAVDGRAGRWRRSIRGDGVVLLFQGIEEGFAGEGVAQRRRLWPVVREKSNMGVSGARVFNWADGKAGGASGSEETRSFLVGVAGVAGMAWRHRDGRRSLLQRGGGEFGKRGKVERSEARNGLGRPSEYFSWRMARATLASGTRPIRSFRCAAEQVMAGGGAGAEGGAARRGRVERHGRAEKRQRGSRRMMARGGRTWSKLYRATGEKERRKERRRERGGRGRRQGRLPVRKKRGEKGRKEKEWAHLP